MVGDAPEFNAKARRREELMNGGRDGLYPVIPAFFPVIPALHTAIPALLPAIPALHTVIPAKAGIQMIAAKPVTRNQV